MICYHETAPEADNWKRKLVSRHVRLTGDIQLVERGKQGLVVLVVERLQGVEVVDYTGRLFVYAAFQGTRVGGQYWLAAGASPEAILVRRK